MLAAATGGIGALAAQVALPAAPAQAAQGQAVVGWNVGSGPGVAGVGGIGVQAAGDVALQVIGPARFQRSGKATIRHQEKSVTVVVPGGLAAGSLALATLQTGIDGVFVAAAVSDTAHGKLRIDLNKAPGTASRPRSATVAWFIVN